MYKYLHILNDIENMIQYGVIKEGKKLPSIRSLVAQYECNKATVIRALHELEKRHIIYSVPQSGYYVVKKSGSTIESNEIIDFASVLSTPSTSFSILCPSSLAPTSSLLILVFISMVTG